jgi:hypothetical protein
MKKIPYTLAGLCILGALVLSSPVALAATPAEEIASLLEQIKTLQKKIDELRQEQVKLQQSIHENVLLAAELHEGMSSEDVKLLQEMLAADREIYPEGLVTGFYGPRTKEAVMRFQRKHGLEAVGFVGPRTRSLFNSFLGDNDFKCRAWGRLIAPGQKRKHGNVEIDVSHCANIPGGVFKKFGDDFWKKGTSTKSTSTDKTAPVIEEIDVDNVGTTTAEISWETNERTRGVLWYSTESDVDLDDEDTERKTLSTLSRTHEAVLDSLATSTKHYFIVVATDKAGNTATSSIQDFTTED